MANKVGRPPVDLDLLSRLQGYDSFREYFIINYYLPRTGPTINTIADGLKVRRVAVERWIEREDLPVRDKGHRRVNKTGFYCEDCNLLTSMVHVHYNTITERLICPECRDLLNYSRGVIKIKRDIKFNLNKEVK